MKRSIVMLGLLLALSGAVAGTAAATDATPATTATTERLQALDAQILTRLNATRAAHGLRPLVVSDELESAAVAHSRDLIRTGLFQHDSPNGTTFVQRLKHFYSPAGFGSWTAGENLLYTTADVDAAAAIKAWLDSPPHRENMLDPDWREIGIGSIHASAAGGTFGGQPTWVITMDFGARIGGPKAVTQVSARQATAAKSLTKATTKHAAALAKRPVAKPTPKQKARLEPKPTTDRMLPVPGGAPFEPPVAGSSDPLNIAAFGHHADDDETAATGSEGLTPVPPEPAPAS